MNKPRNILYILVYNLIAHIFWNIVWVCKIGGDRWMNLSTKMCIKSKGMIADRCAYYVYNASGWHGLNIFLPDGRKGTIVVKIND